MHSFLSSTAAPGRLAFPRKVCAWCYTPGNTSFPHSQDSVEQISHFSSLTLLKVIFTSLHHLCHFSFCSSLFTPAHEMPLCSFQRLALVFSLWELSSYCLPSPIWLMTGEEDSLCLDSWCWTDHFLLPWEYFEFFIPSLQENTAHTHLVGVHELLKTCLGHL